MTRAVRIWPEFEEACQKYSEHIGGKSPLEKTIEEFYGDRSRLYLTGFSMGGAGTYRMAHRWPNRFAALLVVAGPVESGVGTDRERCPPALPLPDGSTIERRRQSLVQSLKIDSFEILSTNIYQGLTAFYR